MNGRAHWELWVLPGDSISGLRLISAAEPGMRSYAIEPGFSNNNRWAYTEDSPDDPDIPRVEDFTIVGMIAAPGCPDVTAPPE